MHWRRKTNCLFFVLTFHTTPVPLLHLNDFFLPCNWLSLSAGLASWTWNLTPEPEHTGHSLTQLLIHDSGPKSHHCSIVLLLSKNFLYKGLGFLKTLCLWLSWSTKSHLQKGGLGNVWRCRHTKFHYSLPSATLTPASAHPQVSFALSSFDLFRS